MITRLIWITWTLMSAVRKRLLNSLARSLWLHWGLSWLLSWQPTVQSVVSKSSPWRPLELCASHFVICYVLSLPISKIGSWGYETSDDNCYIYRNKIGNLISGRIYHELTVNQMLTFIDHCGCSNKNEIHGTQTSLKIACSWWHTNILDDNRFWKTSKIRWITPPDVCGCTVMDFIDMFEIYYSVVVTSVSVQNFPFAEIERSQDCLIITMNILVPTRQDLFIEPVPWEFNIKNWQCGDETIQCLFLYSQWGFFLLIMCYLYMKFNLVAYLKWSDLNYPLCLQHSMSV